MLPERNVLLISLISLLSFLSCQKAEKDVDLMVKKEINSGWMFRQDGKSEWFPAVVPGTVHTDLMRNGIINDPFYRLNEHDVQWIDKLDWEYKTTFQADKNILDRDHVQLCFKGLDTFADVFVNGEKVLETDNMFREWEVDIKELLETGDNELHIIFRSPVKEGIKIYDDQDYILPVADKDMAEPGQAESGKRVSVYIRKAGYHFGWNCGPRLVTSGVWRPVYLQAWDEARIESLHIIQDDVTDDRAAMKAVFEINATEKKRARVIIWNNSVKLVSRNLQLNEGSQKFVVDFEIPEPKLWWTNGLGDAYLYNITGELQIGRRKISERTRIGIRTLELIREEDDSGTTFYFMLNGRPLFMKGANTIPNDIFIPRVTFRDYHTMIETAKTSNMNMLRVWGGGIYEEDVFYDLCDENGILVWQDFMFACSMYPGNDTFLENVRKEAIDNVKRLRNHPCIALWCGNNEILAAWEQWENEKFANSPEIAGEIWQAYINIFHDILPQVVQEYDGQRSYWGSSPSSGIGVPADLVNGDEHYWGVWRNKEPFETYAKHFARFISEYGFQSFPCLSTVKKFTKAEDLDIFSEVMKSHQRSSIGNETIEYYMMKEYPKPKDFPSFLYVSQVLQAEGVKIGMESHRRAKPFCMGSLYWQLNDCGPVISWSSVDYYKNWKALQYYVKKGFQPVIVSPYTDELKLKVGVVNDRIEQVNGQLILKLMDFNGQVVWETASLVEIPGNSSRDYFNENKYEFLYRKDTRKLFFSAELVEDREVIARNTLFFRPFKELDLSEPNLEYNISPAEKGFDIELKTDKLAKNVWLYLDDEEGFFSDNYFEMLPGETVKVHLSTGVSEEKLQDVINIRTLVDAF